MPKEGGGVAGLTMKPVSGTGWSGNRLGLTSNAKGRLSRSVRIFPSRLRQETARKCGGLGASLLVCW